MGPEALRAFLSEYRFGFSVGIDRHKGGSMPVTMTKYGPQGTPWTILVDRAGRVRLSPLGTADDLALGAHLRMLLAEPLPLPPTESSMRA